MSELVLIVEGHGDVLAFPHLVGKVGNWLGEPLFTTKPIRSGGWYSIRKQGGLEKWIAVAKSRQNCRRVVVISDLDDDCPIEERAKIAGRVHALKALHAIDIQICFCLREFESWLLSVTDFLSESNPEYDWIDNSLIEDPEQFRDAKGRLNSKIGEFYSESSDQEILAAALPPKELYERNRSFRCFTKAISGCDYDILQAAT